MIGSSERAGLTRQLAAAVAWQMLQRHAPGDQNRCPSVCKRLLYDDTYELAKIAARGCPPSIIDEPTPEQTPWRRRSIRLHEDAPRRTRPDVLISHAHESPAGLPPPLSFIICFSSGSIVSARRVAVFGRTRSRNQTRSSHQWHVLPCSRSGLRLSFVFIKQNGSRRAGVGHPMKAPGAWVACL